MAGEQVRPHWAEMAGALESMGHSGMARRWQQGIRERFQLPESRSAIASQVISATIEIGLIKPDEKVGASRKFARYLPFWA